MPSTSTFRVPQATITGELDTVLTLHLEDGVVTALDALRNPEKLGRLGEVTTLAR